jgi:hypothetical protein
MISILGESGFSVFHAGHWLWQRPHSVHVAKSSIAFQVKSSTLPTPRTGSSSSISSRSSMVTALPLTMSGWAGAEGDRWPLEGDIDRAHEDVQVLAVHNLDEEAQHDPDVQEQAEALQELERAVAEPVHRPTEGLRHPSALIGVVAERSRGTAEQEHRPDHAEDQEQHEPGAAEVAAPEAGAAAELGRVVGEPDDREDDQADQAAQGDGVLGEAKNAPLADDRDLEVGLEQRAVGLDIDRRQDHEGPEHEEVRQPRGGPLQQLALAEDLGELTLQRRGDATAGTVESVGGRLAAGDESGQPDHAPQHDGQRDEIEQEPEDQDQAHNPLQPARSDPGRRCVPGTGPADPGAFGSLQSGFAAVG